MHVEESVFKSKFRHAKVLLSRMRACRRNSKLFEKRKQAFMDHVGEPEFKRELEKRGGDPTIAYLIAVMNQ